MTVLEDIYLPPYGTPSSPHANCREPRHISLGGLILAGGVGQSISAGLPYGTQMTTVSLDVFRHARQRSPT